MKKSRFSEEQRAMALRQVEAGTPVVEICRSLQITEQTFYRWKKRYLSGVDLKPASPGRFKTGQ
jgi:putative transposase